MIDFDILLEESDFGPGTDFDVDFVDEEGFVDDVDVADDVLVAVDEEVVVVLLEESDPGPGTDFDVVAGGFVFPARRQN